MNQPGFAKINNLSITTQQNAGSIQIDGEPTDLLSRALVLVEPLVCQKNETLNVGPAFVDDATDLSSVDLVLVNPLVCQQKETPTVCPVPVKVKVPQKRITIERKKTPVITVNRSTEGSKIEEEAAKSRFDSFKRPYLIGATGGAAFLVASRTGLFQAEKRAKLVASAKKVYQSCTFANFKQQVQAAKRRLVG